MSDANVAVKQQDFEFDRSKLALSFDVEKLQQDVYNIVSRYQPFYVHYNVVPLTMPGGSCSQTIDTSDDEWSAWQETDFLQSSPYIREVLDSLQCEKTNVRLMRLAPGAFLDEHTDPQLDMKFRKQIRLHVPIYTNNAVEFLLNKTAVPLLPGELWYLKLSDPHSVVNGGQFERIQMSIDVVVNEWIESLIVNGEVSHPAPKDHC